MRAPFLLALLALGSPALGGLMWEKPTQSFKPRAEETEVVGLFKFTNEGKAPVTITKISTSCGCTTAKLDKKTYAPGESGEIAAVFEIGGRVGAQDKRISVMTSASEEPATLTMLVLIEELLTVRPLFIYWSAGEALEPKTLTVKVAEQLAVKGIRVTSSDEHVATEVKAVEEGRAYEIILTPKKSSGPVMATLTIEADAPGKKLRHAIAYARLP